MTIDKFKSELKEVLEKISKESFLSKRDILKKYGTFDKYLNELNFDCNTALLILEYEIDIPEQLQPVIINGPVQLTINPGLIGAPYG